MTPGRFQLAAMFLAVVPAACFTPELPDQITCGEQGECPPGLRCETSAGLCVPEDQAAIAALRFVAPPTSAEALVAASAVTVELLDAAGQRLPITGGSFALEVAANPAGVGLVAPVTGTADAGLVTFVAPELDRPGRAVRLVAHTPVGSIAVTSAPFDVSPTRPTLTLAAPNDELASCGTVPYKLTQAQSLPVDLLVELDPDGPSGPEPFRRATQAASAPGLAGVQGVPGSRDGANRVFSWNTSVDLPLRDVAGQLRITPSVRGVAGEASVRDVTVKNGLRFLALGQAARPLDAADTNHDGRTELIWLNSTDGYVEVPSARIAVPPNVPVIDLTTGDFDGNGLVDLAIALPTKTLIALQLRSSPPGDFAATLELRDVAPLRELVAADFDGDGVDDVAGVEAASGAVVILGGNRAASGQLVERARPWSGDGTGSLYAGDLDRDGWPDLVIGRSSPTAAVVILRGTSAGFMAPSTDSGLTGNALAVGDLDHDGRDDVAALEADGLHVASATGLVHVPGITGHVLGLGDIDGDGRTDVVTVSGDTVQTHPHVLERRTIAFEPPSPVGVAPAVSRLLIKDMDLDGRVDVDAISDDDASLRPFLNDTPRRCGTRLSGAINATEGGFKNLAQAVDLNADGKPDLLGTTSPHSHTRAVAAAYGLGDGTFDPLSVPLFEYPDDHTVGELVPADYDGDGAMDLAFATFPTAGISFLYNDPAEPGRFDRIDLRTDVAPFLLAAGDVDGDGAPDLVSVTSGQIDIRRGDPTGKRTWAQPVGLPTPIEVNDAVCAGLCTLLLDDLDRDGRLDILLSTPTQLLTLLADPGPTHGFAGPIVTAQADGQLITAANLLPDGRRTLVRLVGKLYHPQHVAAYALDASRTAIETVWEGPIDPEGLGYGGGVAVDLDGNGLDEVIMDFHGSALISATPELSVHWFSPGLPRLYRLGATDLDGDGKAEIIVSTYSSAITIDVSADGRLDVGRILSPRGANPGDELADRMALADFSGDGLLDLASVDRAASKVWLARQAPDRPGQLAAEELALPASEYFALGDLDGDRSADVVTPGSGGSLAFLNLDGAAPEPRCTSESSQGPVAIGDVTGDGLADVVTASASAVLLFENPAFSCSLPRTVMSLERPGATKHRAKAIALGDMNVDGLLDVVVISDAVRIALQVPEAPGTFQVTDFEYEDVPPYATYFDGLIADVDQDGQPDVVAIGKHEEIRVFIGNPFFPGKLMPSRVVPGSGMSGYPSAGQGTALVLGDVQGDWWPDIVTMGEGEIRVFLDAGFGNYAFAYSLDGATRNPDGGRLSVVDFDADGRTDVVYVDLYQGTLLLRGR